MAPKTEKTFDDPFETYDRLNEVLDASLLIQSARETSASSDTIRAAAHVLVDRALDQTIISDHERSDFLKRSAGKFGNSGHVMFTSKETAKEE